MGLTTKRRKTKEIVQIENSGLAHTKWTQHYRGWDKILNQLCMTYRVSNSSNIPKSSKGSFMVKSEISDSSSGSLG